MSSASISNRSGYRFSVLAWAATSTASPSRCSSPLSLQLQLCSDFCWRLSLRALLRETHVGSDEDAQRSSSLPPCRGSSSSPSSSSRWYPLLLTRTLAPNPNPSLTLTLTNPDPDPKPNPNQVSSGAFRAFSCEDFSNGRSFLRADYAVECGTDEHRKVMKMAWLGIFMYPVGVPLFYAGG